jgi:hypothetical protein
VVNTFSYFTSKCNNSSFRASFKLTASYTLARRSRKTFLASHCLVLCLYPGSWFFK